MRTLRRLFIALGLPLTPAMGACDGVADLGHANASLGGSSACSGADCAATGGSGASIGGSLAATGGGIAATGGSNALAGGSGAATGGSSASSVCHAGFADCNAISADGCEINLVSDNSNCGLCGNICGPGRTCSQGNCVQISPVCVGTFANCDGDAANGCEMNVATSVDNCGSCGNPCSMENAMPACSNGNCVIAMCQNFFGDCDGNPANGCEADLSSVTNCGGCGKACKSGGTCTPGGCDPIMLVCPIAFADCDGLVANGCETQLATDMYNCGGCGNFCGSNMLCVNAQCVVPE